MLVGGGGRGTGASASGLSPASRRPRQPGTSPHSMASATDDGPADAFLTAIPAAALIGLDLVAVMVAVMVVVGVAAVAAVVVVAAAASLAKSRWFLVLMPLLRLAWGRLLCVLAWLVAGPEAAWVLRDDVAKGALASSGCFRFARAMRTERARRSSSDAGVAVDPRTFLPP